MSTHGMSTHGMSTHGVSTWRDRAIAHRMHIECMSIGNFFVKFLGVLYDMDYIYRYTGEQPTYAPSRLDLADGAPREYTWGGLEDLSAAENVLVFGGNTTGASTADPRLLHLFAGANEDAEESDHDTDWDSDWDSDNETRGAPADESEGTPNTPEEMFDLASIASVVGADEDDFIDITRYFAN